MKTPDWAKQAIVTILSTGGLLGWFAVYHVPALIDSQTKDMSNDVSSLKTATGDLKGDVGRIDTTVNGIMKELLDARLSSLKGIKNQSTQVAKDRLTFVANILGKAKQAGILADPAVVTDAGKNVLELADDSKLGLSAWTATQQLLDCRSFLTPKP